VRATVTLTSKGGAGAQNLKDGLSARTRQQVLVGIPATTAMDRKRQIMSLASAMRGGKRARLQNAAVNSGVNNAELLYILTNGSPLRGIPPAPVVEPAIQDPENMANIVAELELAAKAALTGQAGEVTRQLELAGVVAENAVKAWFVNPKNHWPPNAPSTIRRKGSDRRNIDTGAMRQAITHVLEDKS
jgi:hypothetical protein